MAPAMGFDCPVNPTAQLLEPEVRECIREGLFTELRESLHTLPPADVAEILTELEPKDAAVAFRFLHRDDAAPCFAYLSPEKQQELIEALGNEAAVRIVEDMPADDRARLLDELPEEVAARLVASLSPAERQATQAILGYPPRSVGRLMTPDYVKVRREWTVAQSLEHIRKTGRDAETVNVIYVVDEHGKLVDDIRLRQVLFAEPQQTVESLMNHQFVTLRADMDRSEAVDLLTRYDRVALPVVDSRGALIGIVTHDDVADVATMEATEDMQRMGGVAALEEPFMQTTVMSLFKKRIPWLALLFMSELLTSNAIAAFEDQIKRAAILAAFIPAIISSGGNAGSQASTLVIRALGLKEIEVSDWWRVLRRELIVASMLGLVIASIGVFRINLFGWMGWFSDDDVMRHYTILGWTISLTLMFVVTWGSVIGAMLPFVLKKCKLDPASSSTPFVATLVDVTGIVIYFSIAIMILRTTLLKPPTLQEDALRTSADATVISAKPDSDGDPFWDVVVQTSEQATANSSSVVRVPIKALPQAGLKAGDSVHLTFEVDHAVGVELAPAK